MKTALITGIKGQDGAYLSKFLLEKNYRVFGLDKKSSTKDYWRLHELGIFSYVNIIECDILDFDNLKSLVSKIKPDEVYNLAAKSSVRKSFEKPIITSEINAIGVLKILEVLKNVSPETRFYQASSSELYGRCIDGPKSEEHPFYPKSPYGVSKLFGYWITVNYRETYGLFACNGILFNHESPLRDPEFVTRKITYGLARIKYGLQSKLVLGNDVKRDWGYAPEYVEAMRFKDLVAIMMEADLKRIRDSIR